MFELEVICPVSKRLGFELAGVRTAPYRDAGEARRLLEASLRDPSLGIVILDEELVSLLPVDLVRRSERSERPLVVAVPLGVTAGVEREYLEEAIQRMIGYRVRIS